MDHLGVKIGAAIAKNFVTCVHQGNVVLNSSYSFFSWVTKLADVRVP